jgi:hypothetical protein
MAFNMLAVLAMLDGYTKSCLTQQGSSELVVNAQDLAQVKSLAGAGIRISGM